MGASTKQLKVVRVTTHGPDGDSESKDAGEASSSAGAAAETAAEEKTGESNTESFVGILLPPASAQQVLATFKESPASPEDAPHAIGKKSPVKSPT